MNRGKADVEITVEKKRIRLSGNRQAVIEVDLEHFFKNTRQHLQDLSRSNDSYIPFRAATSLSLLVGFPLMLYWVVSGFLALGFSLFLGRQASAVAGITLCCLMGGLLLLLMPHGGERSLTREDLPGMLASGNRKETVTALKHIEANKIDLHQFDLAQNLSQHPSIPVRYWLARSLSVGKNPQDESLLITLMQDPHPNVACQALYSIGKRKFRRATTSLLGAIKTSDHWYVQLYTYNALRKLGWETDRIKLKTVGLSVAAILMVEWLTTRLSGHASMPILMTGGARSLEIILLLGICRVTEPGGINALGIFPKGVTPGLIRGLCWSAVFGLMVVMLAVVLMLTGLHPADLIVTHLPSTRPGLFAFFMVGGIISPVAEEIFFRGLLYGYFRRWGIWAALLISTAVFVLAHAIFRGLPLPQIVGGILFALAYEKEKNLMVPITIHVLGNLAIFTLSLVP